DRPARPAPRIVVAGAGFAGIYLLRNLREALGDLPADVLLIDRNNYHLFQPLLYQVATGSVEPDTIAYPLRPFSHQRGFEFLCAEVRGVNLIDQYVDTDAGRIPYDYLVLALGSQTNYFGMRDVEERALGLKTIPGATAIRRRILAAVERAAREPDPEARRRLLSFVVVGAGATGVELVGSIHDLLHNNLIPYYEDLDPDDVRIVLIEATDTILPGVDERLRRIAWQRLAELGIEVKLKTAVAGLRDGQVATRGGEAIPGETVIWTAGIRPNPVTAGLPVEKARDGRIVVDEYLRVPSHPNVFVLGDGAYFVDRRTGKALPPNAAVAVREGEATARNLARLVAGEPIEPFVYRPLGELMALGRWHAGAEIGPLVFGGLPAWLVWRMYYLTRLMGMKNRAAVVFDWVTTLFSRRYIANVQG
ncbi:MAG: NAD(P)/FAD-dependent oxidoreductase, partial [Thermomicrobiaceae bacterium]|nr:NAD(P)/FAD-dependent oxidoreductase [Thermomicrobiaceae bacterium]